MRKYAAIGAAALLIVSAISGISYAQDTTPAPTGTQAVAAPTTAQRTWLGIAVNDAGNGVTITQVSANSPAQTAELQVGDVILTANGTSVDTFSDLQSIIEAAAPGDVISLTVERNTQQISVDVTLSNRADRGHGQLSDPLQIAETMLNANLEVVDGGYQVVAINQNTTFALAVGDVITEINGASITAVDWMTLTDPTANTTVTLTVQRDGAQTTLEGQLTQFGGHPGGFPAGNGQMNGGGQPGGNGQPNANNGQPGGFPPGNGQPGSSGDGNFV